MIKSSFTKTKNTHFDSLYVLKQQLHQKMVLDPILCSGCVPYQRSHLDQTVCTQYNEQRLGAHYLSVVYDPLLAMSTSGDHQNKRLDQVPPF